MRQYWVYVELENRWIETDKHTADWCSYTENVITAKQAAELATILYPSQVYRLAKRGTIKELYPRGEISRMIVA